MTQKDNQTISTGKRKSRGANLASNQAEHDPQNNRGLYGSANFDGFRASLSDTERAELDFLFALSAGRFFIENKPSRVRATAQEAHGHGV